MTIEPPARPVTLSFDPAEVERLKAQLNARLASETPEYCRLFAENVELVKRTGCLVGQFEDYLVAELVASFVRGIIEVQENIRTVVAGRAQ